MDTVIAMDTKSKKVFAPHAVRCAGHKTNGEPCPNVAMKGKRVCHAHGGHSLSGIAHPNFINGRYSKALPSHHHETYDVARADRSYLAMREDIALIDTLLADAISKMETGESGGTWRALQHAVHEFRDCEAKANRTGYAESREQWRLKREEAMDTIVILCQEGSSYYAALGEVKDLVERRRRIVESEVKNIVAAKEIYTRDQVELRERKYIDIIARCVTDRTERNAIVLELRRIAVDESGQRAITAR